MLKRLLQQKFQAYLARSQPAQPSVCLTQKRIYILPSRLGLWFALLVLILYLLGTNYQNNLILLSSFMLLSLLLLTMLLAFYNLYQLELSVVADAETFADQPAALPLQLNSANCQMLQLGLQGQRLQQLVPVISGQQAFALQLPQLSRGCYELPRLKLSSQFPFGLFNCWSYPALSAQLWVYPAALAPTGQQNIDEDPDHQGQTQPLEGSEWLKPYQAGDQPRRILWKKLATNPQQPIVRQQQDGNTVNEQWVKVPNASGAALELALQHACYRLQQLEGAGSRYGLLLPDKTLALGQGTQHLQRCLQELALC